MYRVLADFGDFEVVETQTGIDLIDINHVYHFSDKNDGGNKKIKKRKNDKEDIGAYTACFISFLTILLFITKWLLFGY